MDKELVLLKEKHKLEINELKHTLKEIILEQSKTSAIEQVAAESTIKSLKDTNVHVLSKIEEEKNSLRQLHIEKKMSQVELLKDLKTKHNSECTKLRKDFANKLEKTTQFFDAHMKEIQLFYEQKGMTDAASLEKELAHKVEKIMKNSKQVRLIETNLLLLLFSIFIVFQRNYQI